MKSLTIIAVLGVLVSIACCSSCTRIDAGHEGVRVKQYGTDKGVQDVSLVTGRVWYNPFTEDVYEFPVFVQTADYEPFTVNAKDGSVHERTLPKIKSNRLAIYLKLCDRIANMVYSKYDSSGSMYDKYVAEWPEFKAHLFREEFEPMFDYCDRLINLR